MAHGALGAVESTCESCNRQCPFPPPFTLTRHSISQVADTAPCSAGANHRGRGSASADLPIASLPPTPDQQEAVWRVQWRLLLACFLVSGTTTVVTSLVPVGVWVHGIEHRNNNRRGGPG